MTDHLRRSVCPQVEHQTRVVVMGNVRNPIHQAECSCGWESANLHTHRRGAVDDAREHRRSERNG